MIQVFAIFIGGGIGAVLRYLVGIVMFRVLCFPLSTFIANVLGSFIIGFLPCVRCRTHGQDADGC